MRTLVSFTPALLVAAILAGATPLEAAQSEPARSRAAEPIAPISQLSNGHASLASPARLHVVNVSLEAALRELQAATGVALSYSPSLIRKDWRVSCACAEVSVERALRTLLAGTDLEFVALGEHVIVRRKSEPSVSLAKTGSGPALPIMGVRAPERRPDIAERVWVQQQGSIAGRVTIATTGQPVGGAQVHVVGAGLGTIADGQGRYTIRNVPAGTVEVRAQRIGFASVSRTVNLMPNETVVVDFELREHALDLEAIVVTGTPGGTQARAIGNVVTTVAASEAIERRSPIDLQSFLPAEVPGVSLRSGGGQIGVGGTIMIRGAGSLALRNEPLIVVDGVRVDNRTNPESANFMSARARPSRLNDLDLSQIESIEVIKGPAAATLYGTEASNGVIQIITKQGRVGTPRFEVALSSGGNFLRNAERKYPEVWARDPGTGELISANLVRLERERGTPIFTTGRPRSAFASMSGGTENINYYFSVDAGKDEGIVPYQWQNKLAARSNLSYSSGAFDTGVNVGFVRQTTSNAAAEQAVTFQIMWGTPLRLNTRSRGLFINAHEDYNMLEGEEDVDRVTGGFHITHRPFPWLTHRLNVGGDFGNVRSFALWPRTPQQPGPFFRNNGRKDVIQDRTVLTTLDYAASVPFTLSPSLRVETSGGVQYYQKRTQLARMTGIEFPVPGVSTISAAAQRTSEESYVENKTLGVFLQQMWGWNNRVFLTAAVRADDNSAFGEDFSFVTYPKFSASWVVSEEPFLLDRRWLDQLRLRAAWGRAGQQPDVFAASRLYAPATGPGGTPTLTPANIGNPNLKPEVGEEFEIGFDASVLNERLTLEMTGFWQRRKDAIVPQAVLPSLGFPGTQFVNIGEVSNRGIEFGAGTRLVRRRDWGWDVGFSMSTYRNRVEDLGGIVPPIIGLSWPGQRHMTGFPIGSLFMRKVVQAEFGPDGQLRNVLCEGGDPITGGGPPVPCGEAGTAFWGQPTPTWDFGANTTVRWRDLTLSATADGLGGHVKCNGDIAWAHGFFRNTRAILERSDPIMAAYDAMGAICQLGMVDGGFAKLRDVSVRYHLPVAMARRMGATSASLTVSLHNVATLWQATKHVYGTRVIDPEIHSNDDPAGVGDLNAYVQDQWPPTQRINVILRAIF